MNHLLVRSLACLGIAATAVFAAQQARAASIARYSLASEVTPQYTRQSATRLRVEGKDSAGALVGIKYCPAGFACSTLPGAVNSVVVLEYDPNREEVVLEKCNGVVSTVPQLRCENGDLEVTLRVRIAEMVLRTTADSRLFTAASGSNFRFEFRDDATKYWNLGDIQPTGSNVQRFPAGTYKFFGPDYIKHCKPKHLDPGMLVELPAGVRTTVEVRYGATECTVLFTSEVDVSGLSMTSDRGPLTCEARGQRGVPSVKSVCTGVFPFNQPVTVSATVPVGLEPFFQPRVTDCEPWPTPTQCRITPKSDSDLEIFTGIRMQTRAIGAPPPPPPPPPPVSVAFAPVTSAPSAGVAAKGELGVPMLQLTATAQNGPAKIQALTVKASGSGRDDLDLLMVKVVVDANGNGVFDAGETVLAQGRPAADNGELRLGFGSELVVADTTRLLVVADIDNEVRSAAAAALGGATLALALGLFAMPASRRRRLLPVTLVLIAISGLLLKGCGGGGESASTAEPPVALPPVVVPPPVLLTYQLDLIAVEATDSATPAAALTVRALPVLGTTVTVQQ